MSTYQILRAPVVVDDKPAMLFRVAFGVPSTNDKIVRDADAEAQAARGEGGILALIDGPASMPAAFAIAHALGHVFGSVAVKDPKMAGYVVSITHDPAHPLGQVIPVTDVVEA